MRGLVAFLSFTALMLATSAAAGPWPREAGQGFLAFSIEPPSQRGQRPNRVQAYGEYGLRPRLTLAAKVERHQHGHRQEVRLRWHPADLPGGVAWGLGGGLRLGNAPGDDRRAIMGLSLGRGFDTRLGNIWARADVTALWGPALRGAAPEWELAAQLGLNREGWIGMLGLTHDRLASGRHTRLRPALGYEFTPRLTLVGEAALAPGGRREGLALSLWSRF